jgi:hypothetical protein
MDNIQLQNKTKIQDLLIVSLLQEYDFLIYVLATFFSYITIPRDGYITVSDESIEANLIGKPKLTDTMVKYVIRNIIGVDMVYVSADSIKPSEFNIRLFDNKNEAEIKFAEKLSKDTQKMLKSIYNNDIEIITNGGFNEIQHYLNFVFNQFISDKDDSLEQIQSNIENWTHRQGDNVFVPIDYKFNNSVYNTILQTYIWMLCGLTDWLEKDTIDEIDIQTANKILFYSFSSFYNDKLNIRVSKNTPQYTVINDVVSGALYNHDFFVSKTGLEMLVRNISNLISQYHTDLLRSDKSKEQQQQTEELLNKLEKENKLKFKRESTDYLIKEFDTFISSDIYNHLMIFSKQI